MIWNYNGKKIMINATLCYIDFAPVNSQLIIGLLLVLLIAGVVECCRYGKDIIIYKIFLTLFYVYTDTVFLMTIPVGEAVRLLLVKGLLKWEIC